jgi:hypothetical protein
MLDIMSLVVSIVSLIVSLVALSVSRYSLRTAERGARNDVLAQVRAWGDQVVDILSDASSLCALDPNELAPGEFALRRADLISRASSLLDRGRLFFPNTARKTYGVAKPSAFQGLRPPILDLLFVAYKLTRSIDRTTRVKNDRCRLALIHLRRVFVSVLWKATAFSSPSKVEQYEEYLTKIKVEPLPQEIRTLAGAEQHAFELSFDKDLQLKDDYSA